MLHTLGTTSQPKFVPLSNANLAASARHFGETLLPAPRDIGPNIMPVFHIHGLIASLLSSMAAGAQMVCTPGFNALKFFQWLNAARPTWYTAVPTMLQAILGRASRSQAVVRDTQLRFVRSSSSSLPPPVMDELEEIFACPVIEAYGMTEAARQMASNPLPPRARKPGTVGPSAGPDIAIMNQAGKRLARGGRGEIVVAGPNLFAGYENNPEANAGAFSGAWFRTGDLGFIDDGYLTISGRLKEIINRGGEKIAPREVDDVIQAHPAVDQVVTFAIAHARLGEEVAAVAVFKAGCEVEPSEIRAFAARRLAKFKVPSKIIVRDEILTGATGNCTYRFCEKVGSGVTLRVCIYGAGAIGSYLAAKLASTGAKISLVARGAHLQAIRDNGLTVIEAGHAQTVAITATDTPGDLGPQNYVFVTLKAHSIPGAVAAMQPLLGPHTAVVFAVNGVPWWYFHGLAGRHENHWLETVDPDGAIWRGIGPKRAIGCVVYPAAEIREPGVILHRSATGFRWANRRAREVSA